MNLRPFKKQRDEALAFANEIRKEYGLPAVDHLEKGLPTRASECPLARTVRKDSDLRASTSGMVMHVFTDDGMRTHKVPEEVSQFVVNFDMGVIHRRLRL